ncbi:MAG: prolyl oligopeptidase [Planctomycetota bacterium]|jgi:prolyl oligopeptidase
MAGVRIVSRSGALFLALLSFVHGACVAPDAQVPTEPNRSEGAAKTPSNAVLSESGYPEARMGDTITDYHGTQVADPYRWLEDPDSQETGAWVKAQNEVTDHWLEGLSARAEIHQRCQELWNYERNSLPKVAGGHYFFFRNDGLQDQTPLYVSDKLDGSGRMLLDPTTLSPDGTVSIAGIVPSPDGNVLAYGTSDGGSDWVNWRFLSVETGEHLPDVITRNKFGGLDWTEGGQGVIYSRFALVAAGSELHARNSANEVCLHTMGTSEEEDIVLADASPAGNFTWARISTSRQSVVLHERESKSRHVALSIVSLVGPSRGLRVKLASGFDANYTYIGNKGSEVWVQTNLNAPNGRIIAIDLQNAERSHWRELVPERDVALKDGYAVGGHFVLVYLRDAHSEVRVHKTDGTLLRTQELPGAGSVRGFDGDLDDDRTWFSYTDYATPGENWELDVASGATTLIFRPELDLDPAQFETKQVFFSSSDGTRVPMFIVHRRGLKLDGKNPTNLYGYGGFNVSLTPSFRTSNAVWLERGGVLVVANLRGGGEYGHAWHQAGTKLNKQNVFDDFIAAAEWLIANDYTSPEHLAISGGSNGGLLVGACMIQRPDLFAVALPAVGVMDMLRYHEFTIGRAWAGDYGTSEDPAGFRALYAYSPLHNIKDGVSYPATLVTTGDHDDRVVPAHSYKFAARLQAAHRGENPVLIRIETRAGHGAGKSTSMRIDETADILAFMSYFLGMDAE